MEVKVENDERDPSVDPLALVADKSRLVELLKDAANIHGQVAKYTDHQLRAIDVTSNGDAVTFNFSISKKEPKAKSVPTKKRPKR